MNIFNDKTEELALLLFGSKLVPYYKTLSISGRYYKSVRINAINENTW